MTILMKEILADIGVLGTCLPRCLSIPLITSPMETDLLNIQMTVMAMLTEDAEIAKIVANNWNLGFEIKAFNVQKQVWDLLDPDDDLEIPKGARIQVNMHSNDPEDECFNPTQRGDSLAEQKNISRRDPRRKNREVESYVSSTPFDEEVKPAPVAISKRDPRLKVDSEPDPAAKTVNTEPNINNLSRNDPRRRKLLQKSSSASEEAEQPQKDSITVALSSLGSARRKSSHADSDSDEEGELQIDETFQDKPSGKSSTRNMITESQLVEVDNIVDKVDDKDDLELWDEIYGSITSDDGVQSENAIKSGSRVEEKVVAKVDKGKGKQPYFEDRKSIEQLERERELLLNLVKERDRMNEIVASVPAPEEIIIDTDSLEEGELSDSAAEDDEIKITKENSETEVEEIQVVASATKIVPSKRNRSFVNDIQDNDLISPKNTSKVSRPGGSTEKKETTPVRNTVNIDLDDFISPASPTGIQLELDNDEIDVIPLEQGPASPTGIQLNLDNDEIDVIPLEREEVVEIVPKDKYKQYWDEFKEQEKKEGSDQELFEVAREKLSKFKKINEQKELRSIRNKNAVQGHVPPTELFLKATQNIPPFIHPPSTPPHHQSNMSITASSKIGSPGGLFLKAAQGLSPQRPPPLGSSPSRGPPLVPPSGPMVTSVLPRFPPPRPAVMRKGIALLDTPDPGQVFPQPVKAVEPPPYPVTPSFNSSVPPPLASNNFSTPPPSTSTAMKSNTPTPNIVKQNPVKGIPSLMKVNVAKPDEEKQQKPNVWKEGWRPLSKTNDVIVLPSISSSNDDRKSIIRSNSTIRSGSPTRKEFKSGDKNRRQSRDQRSSSRDRKTKDRRFRDKRSQSRSRRSRSRDRRSRSRSRRRSRSKSRRSQSGERRSKSGERSKIGHRRRSSGEKSRKSSTEIKSAIATSKMQASDSVMLAFYEGDDCVIEEEVAVEPAAPRRTEQLPEPVRATTAASSNLFMSSLNKPPVAPSPELHNLTSRHPVSALYEYNRRMNYPQPKFYERWGPGGGWAYDIELGPQTYSCPRFHVKKKDAKADGCKYVLQQLGLKYN